MEYEWDSLVLGGEFSITELIFIWKFFLGVGPFKPIFKLYCYFTRKFCQTKKKLYYTTLSVACHRTYERLKLHGSELLIK